jgi:hypothetical protein
MASTPLRLSKSLFVAGVQCHKRLWWTVHEPNAPELVPSPAAQNRMDQGADVGLVARDHVPGAAYEAAFLADETAVKVDILEQGPTGPVVIEVKASNRVKDEHIPDVAIQVHVLRRSGTAVTRAEVMHLNRECRHPDLAHLFVREDVTGLVEGYLLGVPDEVERQLRTLRGPIPRVSIGEHCTTPRECPFIKRCWPPVPDHHVSSLYRIERRKVRAYEADGFASIHDLPSDVELSAIHTRQVKAVTTGVMVVEPKLAGALEPFDSRLAFLDFETVSFAIPRWNGCRPWENVPVQFSCHREQPGGSFDHHAWIAEGPGDPRPALAAALVEACSGAERVVAYYASFERDCVRHLERHVPALAGPLGAIRQKLIDLLPLVRNHVYHPGFGGSFSLKNVLPALVPALSYAGLAVSDGETASLELMRLMLRGDTMTPAERARLRSALLAYCERDSWAMVKLLERLRGMVGVQLDLF